jgi:hypothetical protein
MAFSRLRRHDGQIIGGGVPIGEFSVVKRRETS